MSNRPDHVAQPPYQMHWARKRYRRRAYHDVQAPIPEQPLLSRRSLLHLASAAGCSALAFATGCARAAPPSPTPPPPPRLGAATFAIQGTPVTNDLASDGYSWANARPLLIDRYGNRIALAQRHNHADKYHTFVYAGADGIWKESTLIERALERGTVAYDATNDILHTLWKGMQPSDGILYRRYTISRDGRNGITDIGKDPSINLILDGQTSGRMQYEHPGLLWLNDTAFGQYGALVATWSARNTGAGGIGNEVRAACCVLGTSLHAGGLAADWSPVTIPATSTIGNVPRVPYSALVTNTGAAIVYPSVGRKRAGTHAGDLYLFYHDGNMADGTAGKWMLRRAQWNTTTNDWRGGLTAPVVIAPMAQGGADRGYDLKAQLATAIVEDERNDRVFVGFPLWRGLRGDTWAFAQVNAADVASLVEVYGAGGKHSYAPTGDIAYDAPRQRLMVAYCTTETQRVYLRLYDRTASSGDDLLAFDAAPVDIPLLVDGSSAGEPAQVSLLLRDTANSPVASYRGWYGTLRWQ